MILPHAGIFLQGNLPPHLPSGEVLIFIVNQVCKKFQVECKNSRFDNYKEDLLQCAHTVITENSHITDIHVFDISSVKTTRTSSVNKQK